ncbi:MAG: RluA family pseudouridine synthase [Phycisphaerales bacterium]|nr:RluA family pseudouridine synthase [Phycisphaerales bacterium]
MSPDMPATTLADWLTAKYPTAKRTTLRRWVAGGRVKVNGRRVDRFNRPLLPTDAVAIDERPDSIRPVSAGGDRPDRLPFRIVFEDADLLVAHKPAGLLTSTVPNEKRPTLLAAVREHVAAADKRARVGLIHRLDRDAAGLLVFTKTDAAYHALKTQFFHHDVERMYHAVCRGRPTPGSGRIESHLVERADGYVYAADEPGRGQVAISEYETVRVNEPYSLVRVKLHTGRKHQIRVHLRASGAPIVGDSVYGHAGDAPLHPRLLLVATRLGFTHPTTGKPIAFELPLPDDMEKLVPGPVPIHPPPR